MIYLIHLDRPLGHAKHYLGYTEAETVTARFQRHKSGYGARLLAAANELGIDYSVVRVWEGSKKLERRLKRRKNSPDLCPVCNPYGWKKRGNYVI